jgi:hypothetical protein
MTFKAGFELVHIVQIYGSLGRNQFVDLDCPDRGWESVETPLKLGRLHILVRDSSSVRRQREALSHISVSDLALKLCGYRLLSRFPTRQVVL